MKEEEMRVVIQTVLNDATIARLTCGACPTSSPTFTEHLTKRLTALEVDSSPTTSQSGTRYHTVTTSPCTKSNASSSVTTASSSATTTASSSTTFTILKLDNLGTALTYYGHRKIDYHLPCFENSDYSLSFSQLESYANDLNRCPSKPFYHSLLVRLYLHYSTSKNTSRKVDEFDEFLALPLGRIQSQKKLTYWIVWMKIEDGSLYALRQDDEDEYSSVEEDEDSDKPSDEDLFAFGIPSLKIPGFARDGCKAVLLGNMFPENRSTMRNTKEELHNITTWETVLVTAAEAGIGSQAGS